MQVEAAARRRGPLQESRLQAASANGLAHGRVSGPIAAAKLRAFLEAERRAENRVLRENVDQERERRGEKPARSCNAKRRFFTRHRLWMEAAKLASDERPVDGIGDLPLEELQKCVAAAHEHFRKIRASRRNLACGAWVS